MSTEYCWFNGWVWFGMKKPEILQRIYTSSRTNGEVYEVYGLVGGGTGDVYTNVISQPQKEDEK